MRDKHLQSNDFFDAKKYPEMSFTCDEIVQKGDKHYAKGTLKIKDVEKTVKFRVKTSDDYISFYTTIYSLFYRTFPVAVRLKPSLLHKSKK